MEEVDVDRDRIIGIAYVQRRSREFIYLLSLGHFTQGAK
jgi:hypothetical protein